jgi:hypothetical protein
MMQLSAQLPSLHKALITGTVTKDEAPSAFENLKQRTTQCKVLINPAPRG